MVVISGWGAGNRCTFVLFQARQSVRKVGKSVSSSLATVQQYRGSVTNEERGNGICKQLSSFCFREEKTHAEKWSHK